MSLYHEKQKLPLLRGEGEGEGEREGAFDYSQRVHVHGADETDGEEFTGTSPFSWKKLWLLTGPGFLMSIAFLDPGNLEGGLQSGAIAGYLLLWLLLWATGIGLLVQLLSARLGVATGRHLAEACRSEYPKWARLLLWVMAEFALIGADIQEVIGSAIAIKILSRGYLPLWAGVFITAFDCFIFLFLENYGVRKLEALFAFLISVMALSFAWMFVQTKPSGVELLLGIVVPKISSKTVKQAVAVVGCSIMPHNVFLHSALVQSRDIDTRKIGKVREAINYYTIESSAALAISFVINVCVTTVFAKSFYGTEVAKNIGLVNAGNALQEKYGGGLFPILYIWAIGVLAAGQSSTITGTYAGQFIMGGFLHMKLKKWQRAMITRSCAIIPTLIVALAFDRSEDSLDILNEWLNILQSIQIPFALIPLLCLVSNKEVMGVFTIGPVLKVSPIHTRRAIRVRLVRSYEVPALRGQAISKSKECLFHDEEGTYIHGTISREDVVKYRSVFVEGKVYSIKNFLVVTNYYTYKTSTHKYLIKFNYSTTVKECKTRKFPNFMFRLKSFQSLMDSTTLNDKELFDIMGRVVEIHSPVEKLIAGKPSRLMDFLIEDTEERQLKCTIWDDHVDAMLPYFNSTEPEPVIVLIQLCRAKTVNGEVRITSSYDATKLWFNHYCREFTEFKAKLTKENTPMKSISTNSMVSQTTDLRDFISGSVVITTISELYQQTESGDFYVPAMITGIESSGEWYYISCKTTGCNKKLKFENGLLYCEKCDHKWQNGTVRYKLVVRVADAGSDAPFLLWDRECSELLGMTADSLYSRSVKEVVDVPTELESLIGKAMVFKVNIKKDYKQNYGSAFGVMKILNDENIVAAYCSSFGVDQEKDLISKMLEDYGNEYSEDDESGGDEVNRPNNIIKPRQQEVEQEMSPLSKRSLLDQFSSTQQMKKGRLEVIKKEKIV